MSSTVFKIIPNALCKQKPALLRLMDDERICEYATNIQYMKEVKLYLTTHKYAHLYSLFKSVR